MLLPCSIDLCLPDTYPPNNASTVPGLHLRCVILDQSAGAEGGHFTTALIQGSDSSIKMAIDLLKIGVLHAKAADDRPTLAVKVNTGPAEQAASDLNTFAQEISGMAFSTHHVAPSVNFVQRPS